MTSIRAPAPSVMATRAQATEELRWRGDAAAKKAGRRGQTFGRRGATKGRSTFGPGRRAALPLGSRSPSRRGVVTARIVRHRSGRFRSGPLSKHVAYLKRDGVTRDGAEARMLDANF